MTRLLLLLLLLSTTALAQGPGRITGRIASTAGAGLEGVSVLDQSGHYGTLTDGRGQYVLDKLPLGTYTLITRSLSHAEGRREVTLTAEQPGATADFILAASTNAMQEVEVLSPAEVAARETLAPPHCSTCTSACRAGPQASCASGSLSRPW